jgi:hypothetical protein
MSEYELELEHQNKHEVRIHIDRHRYESSNPTTAAALYLLGHVAPGLELYREVNGNREDEPIENGPEIVHLKQDEHFHSGQAKTYTIYVNGQQKVVMMKTETFAQIVALAFPTPPTGSNIVYTVSYEDGPRANSQGSLKDGQSVKVKDGMIFNVTATDRS